MSKKKYTRPVRKCKVRINIRKFENIQLVEKAWGFPEFWHCLN